MKKHLQADFRRLVNGCIEQCLQLRFKQDKKTMLEYLDEIQRRLVDFRFPPPVRKEFHMLKAIAVSIFLIVFCIVVTGCGNDDEVLDVVEDFSIEDGNGIEDVDEDVPMDALLATLSLESEGLLGVISVAFSPDGGTLAGGGFDSEADDDGVWLWDVATGDLVATLPHEGIGVVGQVNSVAFNADGTKLVSASSVIGPAGTVQLWDFPAGTPVATLGQGRDWSIYSVAFSPDGGTLAIGGSAWRLDNTTLWLWDVAADTLANTFIGHERAVNSVAFSSDGSKLASGSDDETARIWNPVTGALITTLNHEGFVKSVAFSPDGAVLACGNDWGSDATLRLWDVAAGTQIRTLPHEGAAESVAFSPDGSILASGGGETVALWDVDTGALIRGFKHSKFSIEYLGDVYGDVESVAFSPDSATLATAGDTILDEDKTEVRLWDIATLIGK